MNRLKLVVILNFYFFSFQMYATISDTFGINPETLSLARSNIYSQSNVYAAKDNPAGLSKLSRPAFSISYFYTNFNLANANQGRISPASSRIVDDQYDSSKASSIKNSIVSLAIPLFDNLAFGLTGLLPTTTLATVYTSTKNEVRYLLYDDRSQRPEIYSSLGYKLSKHFSIGAGLFYSVKADGTVQIGMSTTDADARTLLELTPELIPFGSMNFDFDHLTLGMFYRAPQKAKTTIKYDIDFAVPVGSVPFTGGSSLVAYYDPQILGLGASYSINAKNTLHTSVRKSFWSSYTPPIIRLSGKDLESYTSGNYIFDRVRLKDSYDVGVGYEIKKTNLATSFQNNFKWGLAYHESALPDHPQSLAVVDTDRVDISTGTDFLFGPMGKFLHSGLTLNLGLVYSILKKQTLISDSQVVQVGKNIFSAAGGVSFEY
ncbi:MAG: hypothetical protein A2381_08485 [Bdellovibrionales bacterium RIFOXYB1_FULL_37_110]|nr:MAG: hypothetical protein A2417_14160 [Bdellovibrionales bacterium RIFOXYC1_FULL_37_79]OFZ58243.1 MAG: hypothetical protein A2381_08485 [Bdellovibrionales bacterium RIFOXYB1_FULL_37_110]OFZ62284.1 MAG: hypothetical protein A2577_17050 [Bdellovibrionales bacterium RIFOXYD1_FULL_36_51]